MMNTRAKMPRILRCLASIFGAIVLLAACSLLAPSEIEICLPATCVPYGESIAETTQQLCGCRWKIRWGEGEVLAEAGQTRLRLSGLSQDITAIVAYPVSAQGYAIGPPVGAILRWNMQDERFGDGSAKTIVLEYQLGWIAEVALELERRGVDCRYINLEKLQEDALAGTEGRPFLLDVQAMVDAVTVDCVFPRCFTPWPMLGVPAGLIEQSGWCFQYPPQPGLPAQLPPGEYTLFHPEQGFCWLFLQEGQPAALLPLPAD